MWLLCNRRFNVSSECCHPGLPVKLEWWSSVVQRTSKDKFPRYTYLVHLLAFGEWHFSPLWEQSHQRHFFTTSKTPKKKKNVHPASRSEHSVTTVPCSAVRAAAITRPNLRQVGCIFKLGQLLRLPGKERRCDGPCCLPGGSLRSTGGFEATVPTEKPHHPRERTQRGLSFKRL